MLIHKSIRSQTGSLRVIKTKKYSLSQHHNHKVKTKCKSKIINYLWLLKLVSTEKSSYLKVLRGSTSIFIDFRHFFSILYG